MKTKFFNMYGDACDKDGKHHVVTIVGKLEQKKEYSMEFEEVNIKDKYNNTKVTKGITAYPKKTNTRTLSYAVSICHTDDEFDEQIGIDIAKKRVETKPLGRLTTNLVTTLCEDQIKWILFGELNFVISNIDKYISNKIL